MTTVHDFSAVTLEGKEQPLNEYKGKVLLIVNTASKCGLTPQYKDLQKLYETFADEPFEVLGFPCNQFAEQEPGTNEEIASFCQKNYGVTFPMFEKVDVNGENAHPLFNYLTEETKETYGQKDVKWNFEKFLITKDGTVAKRFSSQTEPSELKAEIERLL
ncbi:glutathione peroxidase [Halalkalibacterium ligniniphilum]|uniref:glutathione peroxidase n=1 Tax=Halalkalibacterium ligniniphilum TaxID=1134413 RepID=UPI00034D74DD|nr:glutathione peroxidase [Halalkalibacterium ligniniphilum]